MADMFSMIGDYADDVMDWIGDEGIGLAKKAFAGYGDYNKSQQARANATMEASRIGGKIQGGKANFPVSQTRAIQSEDPLAHESMWKGRLATYINAASSGEVKSSSVDSAQSLRSISLNIKGS